jgi:hypothetical protein
MNKKKLYNYILMNICFMYTQHNFFCFSRSFILWLSYALHSSGPMLNKVYIYDLLYREYVFFFLVFRLYTCTYESIYFSSKFVWLLLYFVFRKIIFFKEIERRNTATTTIAMKFQIKFFNIFNLIRVCV